MTGRGKVVVRRITAADGPLLRATRLEMLADTPSAFGSTLEEEEARPDSRWAADATDRASGTAQANFFAERDHATIGVVGCYFPDPARAVLELVSMWVRHEDRGGPAARLLVEQVLRFASDTQSSAVELWVTRGNDRAQRFYQRMGFELTGATAPLPSDPCKDEQRMRFLLPAPGGA